MVQETNAGAGEMSVVEKPWGSYEVIHRRDGQLVKILTVMPHQSLSLQSHEHRAELWYVLDGVVEAEVDDKVSVTHPNGTITIPIGSRHRLTNRRSVPAVVLEVAFGEKLLESDITRYKDRYGRKLGNAGEMAVEQLTLPITIAEVGCNHRGEIDTAIEMIKVASQYCKASVVKFQKRTNRELLTPEEFDTPHPNPQNAFGDTYGAHREYLEFTLDQHRHLKAVCEEWGVVYSTSVWDVTSAKEIASIHPVLIKVPSATNTNQPVMEYLFTSYEGQVHVSLGMTTRAEEAQIVEMARRHGRLKDLVLYHCISAYPADERDLALLEIPRLVREYGERIGGIGFSGHHRGIASDIAALALGAQYFERHFTLDRTWKGTDHAASLEPNGLRLLVRDLSNVSSALKTKPTEIADVEQAQRKKLKRAAGPAREASRSA